MVFIQFYEINQTTNEPVPVSETGSIMTMQDDVPVEQVHAIAQDAAKLKKYFGYILYKGSSYFNANPFSKLILIG